MKKRNWEAICKLTDRYFRLAVSLTEDPDFLYELQRRWPELFLEGKDEGPLRIPLSALVRATQEAMQREEWEHFPCLNLYMPGECGSSHLSLPEVWVWDSDDVDIPQSVLAQIEGKSASQPLIVRHAEVDYIVSHVICAVSEDGAIDLTLGDHPHHYERRVVLTPIECVDLNA